MPVHTLRPRLRVLHGEEIALGPGKARLLEAIEGAGTLAEAASRLQQQLMAVEAAQASYARVQGLSLFDYLR